MDVKSECVSVMGEVWQYLVGTVFREREAVGLYIEKGEEWSRQRKHHVETHP